MINLITPLDIENKKFSKQMMNGYNVEEVDDFLDELTLDYTKNYKEVNELRDKVEELNKKHSKLNNASWIFAEIKLISGGGVLVYLST